MGPSVERSVAHYRLVYLQPDPETAERVCVAVLFDEGINRRSLVFERSLSRLRCLAPGIERDLVAFYLESLEASVQEGESLEIAASRFAPHFALSAQRLIGSPITQSVKLALLERFAAAAKVLTVRQPMQASVEARRLTELAIATFIDRVAEPFSLNVIRDVRPDHILGVRRRGPMKKVAAAIVGRSKVLLLDGVDLNSAVSPAKAVSRTNEVVHKFWQYKRLRENDVLPDDFVSVGLVINGHAHRGGLRIQQQFEEAHDYAVEQFRQETAFTVDTRSQSDQEQFSELLRKEAIAL